MSLLTAAIVGAAVQIFDGRGECKMGDFAPINALNSTRKKKAGVYLKTFSHPINSKFTDDEVSAVTTKIIEPVGAVHHENKTFQLTD